MHFSSTTIPLVLVGSDKCLCSLAPWHVTSHTCGAVGKNPCSGLRVQRRTPLSYARKCTERPNTFQQGCSNSVSAGSSSDSTPLPVCLRLCSCLDRDTSAPLAISLKPPAQLRIAATGFACRLRHRVPEARGRLTTLKTVDSRVLGCAASTTVLSLDYNSTRLPSSCASPLSDHTTSPASGPLCR